MQSVIGGYRSFEEARRAVRSLEPLFSIQDVLIADSARSMGRKLHLTDEQKARWKSTGTPAYLVAMTAEPSIIARATTYLRGAS